MIAVINSSPLISLAVINQLSLLKGIFTVVHVPAHVYQEVLAYEAQKPGAYRIQLARLKVTSVADEMTAKVLSYQLDRGEAEVIALGCKIMPDFVIIDELKGRRIGKYLGLNVTGTIGLLLMAKELQLINKIRPFLDDLIEKGIWISDKLYSQALTLAREKD